MKAIANLFTLSPLLATHAAAVAISRVETRTPSSNITWGACDINVLGQDVQCSKLTVPLDYNQSCSKTIQLDLIRSKAKTQPAPKGSMLLNFGGPGGDGLNNFVGVLDIIRPLVGDEHDLISWDPRGTRNTLPVVCWDSTSPNAADLPAFASEWYRSSDTAGGQIWSESTVLASLCTSKLQDIGPYVGMAAVARDIISIVDALGEDGMLRYWGISGGTTMGATVAAMFPDRMDKIILDGVMNAHQYYHNSVETEFSSSADDIMRGIFAACVEAGEQCPLAAYGKSVEDHEATFDSILEEIKHEPIPIAIGDLGIGMLIDYNMVLSFIFTSIYYPSEYQKVVMGLDYLYRRDIAGLLQLVGESTATAASGTAGSSLHRRAGSNITATPGPNMAVLGIRCGDKSPRASGLEELMPQIETALETSKWFGDFGLGLNAFTCAQWEFQAVERYSGDFNVKTKNPILFVSNTYDPVTPLVSAQNMSSTFEGSVVIEKAGYGHVSYLTQPSDCLDSAIYEYIHEGVMPEPGTVCKTNYPLVAYITGEVLNN